MANLGNVSILNINGNELSIKDAALTEIVEEIIEAIGANNDNIAERINNLHDRSFDAEIKISSVNETEISNIIDGLYKLQYVTITGEGTEATETLNNSAILIQKGTNQYLIKDGQILSRIKTNNTWGTWASTISLELSNEYEMSSASNSDLDLESGDTYEEAFGKLEKTIRDNEYIISSALNNLNDKVEDIPIYDTTNKLSADYIENGSTNRVINVQADWNQTTATADDYIKNKPTIPAAQIQADWNQTTDTALDYIKNKPTIPAAQIQADWNQTTDTAPDYIKNKPTIPAAQVQADWNQTTDTAPDYIKNKPTIPTVPPTSTTVTQNDTNPVSGGAVYAKFADLIGSAPATLDTLQEIAAALNNDANLVGTLTTQISSKIPKVSNPTTNNFASFNSDGTIKDSGVSSSSFITTETQPDWEEDNTSSAAYIQNKPTIKDELSNEYEMSSASNSDLDLESGDTYEEAFGKLEKTIRDDEYIISSALNNLNDKVEDIPIYDTTNKLSADYIENGSTNRVINVQADWNQTTTTADDYIKNKPTIPAAQIQADWNQTTDTALDYIKNKPTIPAAQIQADWNQTTDTALDYIKNKPTIPAAQVPADWNQTITTAPDYIKNKPTIPAAQIQADWEEDDTSSAAYIQNKPNIKTELSDEYEMSAASNRDLLLESGDTYEEAFSKLEKIIYDNEYVISSALNDLNDRVEELRQLIMNL